MSKKADLRKYLLPISVTSYDKDNQKFVTTNDLVAIDAFENLNNLSENERKSSLTDFAIDNNATMSSIYTDDLNLPTGIFYTSDNFFPGEETDDEDVLMFVGYNGKYSPNHFKNQTLSLRPNLKFNLTEFAENEPNYADFCKIETQTRGSIVRGKKKVHILKIGEYPKSNVSEQEQIRLEELYNDGNLKDGIKATGRLFTSNGDTKNSEFLSKQNPEFEVDGQKYVRTIAWGNTQVCYYNDDSLSASTGAVKWKKVEPITFKITNWNDSLKDINLKDKSKNPIILNLKAEQGILSGIPFYPNKHDNMWKHSVIRCFLNSENSKNLNPDKKFQYRYDFLNSGFLYQALNLNREPTKEYVVSEFEKEICDYAFAGCVGLEKIVIHNGIEKIGKHAFDGCNFKFAYTEKKTGNLILSKSLPKNIDDCENLIDLKPLTDAFQDFDYNVLYSTRKINRLLPLVQVLKKSKFKLPYCYAETLDNENLIDKYVKQSDFRFLKTEIPNLNDLLNLEDDEEKITVYKFASALGCFSNKKVLDKDGKETDVLLAQKASPIFAQLLKNKTFNIGEMNWYFIDLPLNVQPNQEFLKFLSIREKDGKFSNMEMLKKLDNDYPGILIKTIKQFPLAMQYRTSLKETGTPVNIPWEEALVKFFQKNKFDNVTDQNRDIADLFASKGLIQSHFDRAIEINKNVKEKNIPSHILKKSLKEETILESIEKIKNQTEAQLIDSKNLIDELYSKKFTYEMLDKHDPKNFIIGIYSSCCCTISSSFYGKSIAKASVEAPDVQNMIVRDSKGEIVAKGTMYVNEKQGYAVFNDFEVNSKYKKHELNFDIGYGSGYYDVRPDSPEEKDRDMIFDSFMRGINAFVKEYDNEHPSNPIKKVNVGMGYNRLKKQCKNFKQETKNLTVPADYEFNDAKSEQIVLYDRKIALRKSKKEEVTL